jgi:hypothetical protein
MVFADTLDEFVKTLGEVAQVVSNEATKKGYASQRSP